MQNTTHLNANSTALMPRSHGRLLSGLIIAFHIPLIILIYFIYNYFFHKRPSASNSPPPVNPSSPGNAPALQLRVVNSIPMTDFKTVGTEKVECVVCLVEFKDGDKLRVLPQCCHRFHVDCVDMWFRSHANCPLCRTAVVEKVVARSESMV